LQRLYVALSELVNIVFHNFKKARGAPPERVCLTPKGMVMNWESISRRFISAILITSGMTKALWGIFAGQHSVLENQANGKVQPTLSVKLIRLKKR
jgi:hypothetical protein